jgi:uncharacterized membrane protein YdbT with pleckstrin-like domain
MNMDNLLNDETVIYEGKLHWSIFLMPVILCFFAVGGIVGLLVIKHPIPAGLLFLVAVAIILPTILRYSTNGLVLTNKRVISSQGVTSRRSIDISLQKIEGVSVDQSLMGQIFNYGTIVIRGTGGGLEKFPLLGAPAEFTKELHQQIGIPQSGKPGF